MNIQRAPRLKVTITNSIVNETSDNSASSSRNSHFTPCRRVGLSRKKGTNAQVSKTTVTPKNEEPTSSSSQQMPTEKHVHKSSSNDTSSMRKDEVNKSNDNYRLHDNENGKPINIKQDDNESETETKYSHSSTYTSQRDNVTNKSRKKSKSSKPDPPPRENQSESVSNNGDYSDSNDEREELPELKKRKRESYNVNTVEHAGTPNNGISSIEIKNILTGIDPELAKIEESNSPSNLSLSSVKKISIHVKQKLEQNKWSTSTKVHLSQDDQAVSDVDSVAGHSDLSDFSESSSSKRRKRTSTSRSRKSSPKPGPSRPSTDEKIFQPPPSDSDSEDDFISTPKSHPKEISLEQIKSETLIRQPVVKLERSNSVIVRQLKEHIDRVIRAHTVQDDLNKTEQIRISKNKSYNVIYKESDIDSESVADSNADDAISMIIEQRSYITEQPVQEEEDGDPGEVDERSVLPDMFDNLEQLPIEPINPLYTSTPKPVPVKRSKLTLIKPRTLTPAEQARIENPSASVSLHKTSTNTTNEANTAGKQLDVGKLRKRYIALQNKIKVKQEKVETLKRVSVYKKTHDLDELRAVTLQHKEGAQSSLFDMLLLLNSVSHDPCDMKTLLHNLKIPSELVDYNAEEDKFM